MARLVRAVAVASGSAAAAYYGWKGLMHVDSVSYALTSAVAMPVLKAVEAETAHNLGCTAAELGLLPRQQQADDPVLHTTVWNLHFSNPVGLAAGFDKHAQGVESLLAMGFGFVEAGSVTPQPQPGNAKPRVFRLAEDGAVINRYGFNSVGIPGVLPRLVALPTSPAERGGVFGINLGKNKAQEHAVVDYCRGLLELGPHADYVVVNVSSPNTPGLRRLQGKQQLKDLLSAVKQTRDSLASSSIQRNDGNATSAGAAPRTGLSTTLEVAGRLPPLLVKIAPDMSDSDLEDVAAVVIETGIDGIIVSNTTVARPPSLRSSHRGEGGGLSGKPLLEPSTRVLAKMFCLTQGQVPLVGVGGVDSGETAYAKVKAGASLVQLYTALSLQGPGLVPQVKTELAECLKADGFSSVAEAVGCEAARYAA